MGGSEILLILLVVLLLFGSNKIPDIARTLGKGLREFHKVTDEIKREIHDGTKDIHEGYENIHDSYKEIHKDLKENPPAEGDNYVI